MTSRAGGRGGRELDPSAWSTHGANLFTGLEELGAEGPRFDVAV